MDDDRKSLVEDPQVAPLYGTRDLSEVLSARGFPLKVHDPRHVYSAIRDELMLDGNARQNLATFCQTYEEPEIHQLMDDCIDKNMVDKDEYPQTAEIEQRCVHMLADRWHAPGGESPRSKTLGTLATVDQRRPKKKP